MQPLLDYRPGDEYKTMFWLNLAFTLLKCAVGWLLYASTVAVAEASVHVQQMIGDFREILVFPFTNYTGVTVKQVCALRCCVAGAACSRADPLVVHRSSSSTCTTSTTRAASLAFRCKRSVVRRHCCGVDICLVGRGLLTGVVVACRLLPDLGVQSAA